MLIDGKKFEVLNFDDINSLVSLEHWIKNNLTIFREDQKIKSDQLKIFIEFLKEKSKDQRVENKRKWLEQFDKLLEWIDNPRRKEIGKRDKDE